MTNETGTRFEQYTEPPAERPTLIEGLPGLGMVASIAVDQITDQLGLEQHGSIVSEDFPPAASFADGRVRDLVRVYAGEDPPIMTLQSDVPIPPNAVGSLSECVHTNLASEFERAIFIAGAPAESEEEIGQVEGVATDDEMAAHLADGGVALAEAPGVIGGITGGLVAACYHEDVPAAVLVVRSNPYIPDPGAARVLIEESLEPLVDFDIDTRELREQAEQIQEQKEQIAKQVQQYQQQQQQQQQPSVKGMYQ
ncbi:MAG: PAC2 family protein [Haloarculaceae archaeon]